MICIFLNATYARDILFDTSIKICSSPPDLKPFLPLFLFVKKKEKNFIHGVVRKKFNAHIDNPQLLWVSLQLVSSCVKCLYYPSNIAIPSLDFIDRRFLSHLLCREQASSASGKASGMSSDERNQVFLSP